MHSELLNLIKEDSTLPAHIKYTGDIINASEISTVLLTGLTGNLGPYLLKDLLKRKRVKLVYCLVRDSSIKFANEVLEYLDADRVVIIGGSLAEENLGLDEKTYDELSNNVDTIIHMAVKSHHIELYQKNGDSKSDTRTINVLGTLKILELASKGKPKRILYGSSVLACNRMTEEGIFSEDLIEEDNYGEGINMGYVVSKFVTEKLMSEAIRRGLQCLVMRYGPITGEQESGFFDFKRVNNGKNHIFSLLVSYLQTRQRPVYMSAFPTVPVDICASVSLDLLFNDNVPSGFFNVANPHGQENDDFIEVAARLGITVSPVDFKTFSETLRKLDKKAMLYPLRHVYFRENAEELISKQSVYMNVLTQKDAGGIVSKVSAKFKMYLPNYEDTIETPNEIIYKMLLSADVKSYL